jgi:aryl-alcohol dehydrogenase-like predicted oxidoreductase
MKRRALGKTNLAVSEIGAGCWAIGGGAFNLGMGAGWDDVDEKEAIKGLFASVELGINLFDTANVYGLGKSERLLSLLWKEKRIKREDIIVASKLGYFQGCAEHGYDLLNMQHQLEMSLRNLGSDYIDIYFFHHLDFGANDRYLENAVRLMIKFQDQGKIRFIGLRGPHRFSILRKQNINKSENEYERFIYLFNLINPAVIGVRYNMISPTFDKSETDIFEWAAEKKIGVVTYKPLGQGLLLDKYDPDNPPSFTDLDHRSRKRWFEEKGLRILKEKIANLKNYFGISTTPELVQLAIAYCLYKKTVSSVLVGFKNKTQLLEALNISQELTKQDINFIQLNFKDINSEIGNFIEFK